ncbi:MAG: hypothetical protein GXY64_08480 [Bacteroidales bacterium]|nr:hypothetical protein [Bacteroidales bacterium]
MIIDSNTEMLLFRYNNYKKHLFIDEHRSVLQREGHVWMLKLGRKTNNERIRAISEGGGWMILRAPKSEGGTSFLAKFTEMQEETPTEHCYPEYYKEIFQDSNDNFFYYEDSPQQWFNIVLLFPLNSDVASSLVISKNKKKVDDVIPTTRTAVMFVQNDSPIEVSGVV